MLRASIKSLSLLFILIISGCGGGSRGTGDLQISGTIYTTSQRPVAGATIALTSAGDEATTDAQGQFLIVTDSFSGSPEFLIESGGKEVLSRGGSVTKDAAEVLVTIEVDLSDAPTAKQKVEIKRRRSAAEDSKGEDDIDNSDNSSGDSDKGDESEDSGDDKDNSSDDSGENDPQDEGKGSDDRDDADSGNNSGDSDQSSDTTEWRVEAPISAIGTESLAIAGRTVYVDSTTKFGSRKRLDQFSVGENVEVRATEIEGVWFAEEVRLK